jgi:hypothetical protein
MYIWVRDIIEVSVESQRSNYRHFNDLPDPYIHDSLLLCLSTDTSMISLTHIYMTAYFAGFLQTLQ